MPSRVWEPTAVEESAPEPAPPRARPPALAAGVSNAATARALARTPVSPFRPAVPVLSRDLLADAVEAGGQLLGSIGTAIGDALNPEHVALTKKYGDEASWPAPVEEYQTPFDNDPQSSPGERILMNGEYKVVPGPEAHAHELTYSATDGGFDTASGPRSKSFRTGTAPNRIDTGNVSYFLPSAFKKGDKVEVKAEIKVRRSDRVVHTRKWTYTARDVAPKSMAQKESGDPRPIGSTYEYLMGPALPTGTRPFYEHQTILEEFKSRTSNLQPEDMKLGWRVMNFIITKPQLDAKLFSGASNNGTFVVDSDDKVFDVHGGGQGMLDEAEKHLEKPKDIHIDLPQTYTAGPGNVIGKYVVRRTKKTDGTYELRKWAT